MTDQLFDWVQHAADERALDVRRTITGEAIARVERNADTEWKAAAAQVVWWLALTCESFTTDAVWDLLECGDVPKPREERAMGAVMQAAARAGQIKSTDRTEQSERPECHMRRLMVWQSLSYAPGAVAEVLAANNFSIEKATRS